MKVKSGQAVIDAIKLAYAAKKPVMLEGKHGVGKSQLIEQAAKEMKISCIVRDLSLMEAPDLVGLPYQSDGRTRYSPPSFLPTDGAGLLVFEELNRAEKYMQGPCLQLLTAKTLNDYRLPDGFMCLAAINPAADGYDSASELDAALLSRFIRITVEADVKEFLKWADANNVHHAIARFLRSTPDVFAVPESNPRAWTWASDLLHAYEQNGGLLTVAISGLVGDALGTAMVQHYLNGEEPIQADEILRNYDKHRATIQQWLKIKKTDLLNATAHGVLVRLQDVDICSEIATSNAMQHGLGEFMKDLPGDIGKRVKQAAKKAGALP